MPLTEIECKNAKASERTRKVSAENGLYLEITPTGRKYWRYKYRFAGKEKRLALGVYPEISLKRARELRDDAKIKLRNNIDPSAERKAIKQQLFQNAENSFQAVAKEWLEKRAHLLTEKHSKKQLRILELNVFPILGNTPVNNIAAPEVLFLLRKIEAKGTLIWHTEYAR